MAKPKMRAVAGSPDERLSTRDALLRSAVTCFSTRGFSATSIQDIATYAGVAKGNVYHYFSGKDEILSLILHGVMDDLTGAVDLIPAQELGIADQLRAWIGVMVDFVGHHRAGTAIFVQERRRLSRSTFGDVLTRSDEIVTRLTALLERGIAEGAMRRLPSPRLTALGLIGMAAWVYQWYRPGRHDLAEIAEMYASVVLDGLNVVPGNTIMPTALKAAPRPNGQAIDSEALGTRDALVRAALDLFAVNGYDNTSMGSLARRANVTTGAFYSQFASKEDILRHIDNQFLDRLVEAMSRTVNANLPAADKLTRLMTEQMSQVGDHPTELTVFLQEWRFFVSPGFADVRAKSAQIVQSS